MASVVSVPPTPLQDQGRDVCTSSRISSAYFDSPDLYVYHSRLVREDGAQLVRLRYVGGGEGQLRLRCLAGGEEGARGRRL